MNNVTSLPPKRDMVADMTGPARTGNSVIIDGTLIPRMRMHDRGQTVEFVLDDRLAFEFPREWAYLAASFAATAMAVGAGYPSLTGDHDLLRPFATPVMGIGELMK